MANQGQVIRGQGVKVATQWRVMIAHRRPRRAAAAAGLSQSHSVTRLSECSPPGGEVLLSLLRQFESFSTVSSQSLPAY
eukprot:763379-Hanusia_phi.AAC.11